MTFPIVLIRPLGKSPHVNVMQQCCIEHPFVFLLSALTTVSCTPASLEHVCPLCTTQTTTSPSWALKSSIHLMQGSGGKSFTSWKVSEWETDGEDTSPSWCIWNYSEWFREAKRGREQRWESAEVRCSSWRGERQSNRAQIIRENSLWDCVQVQGMRPDAKGKPRLANRQDFTQGCCQIAPWIVFAAESAVHSLMNSRNFQKLRVQRKNRACHRKSVPLQELDIKWMILQN